MTNNYFIALIEVDIGQQWQVNAWMLVHRDMLNMPKVRAFIDLVNRASLHLAFDI
ncbi:hypothetical protein [Pseudoalteromonas luteoviolacea]|uniref:hypothetical protein n=1 Tax=Pseudoalteromonas luteoviolacea TaxID=43657 RepID=UPI00159F054E|nr:hypothetical protein [Pseudoalteromonas luteoviolacea]